MLSASAVSEFLKTAETEFFEPPLYAPSTGVNWTSLACALLVVIALWSELETGSISCTCWHPDDWGRYCLLISFTDLCRLACCMLDLLPGDEGVLLRCAPSLLPTSQPCFEAGPWFWASTASEVWNCNWLGTAYVQFQFQFQLQAAVLALLLLDCWPPWLVLCF